MEDMPNFIKNLYNKFMHIFDIHNISIITSLIQKISSNANKSTGKTS